MKKIITILFIASNIFTFNKALAQITNKSNIEPTKLGNKIKLDTLVIRKKEISLNKRYINTYKRDEEAFELLSPSFLPEIVSPMDTKNSTYLAYMNLGKSVLKTVRESALKKILAIDRWKKKFLGSSGDPKTFDQYRLIQIPVYYLSPNAVLFKDGENIAKYYNLITGDIRYAILKDGAYFGMIDYYNGEARILSSNKPDSIGYSEVLKLKKTIIGLKNFIPSNPKQVRSMIDMFGYLLDQHIVFSYYYEENVRTRTSDGVEKETYKKVYEMKLADSFYFNQKGNSILNQFIDSSIRNFKPFKKE